MYSGMNNQERLSSGFHCEHSEKKFKNIPECNMWGKLFTKFQCKHADICQPSFPLECEIPYAPLLFYSRNIRKRK